MCLPRLIKNTACIVLICSILASCDFAPDYLNKSYDKLFESIYDRKIFIPKAIDSTANRIINYIDGDCSACIGKMILWNKLLNESNDFKNRNKIIFIVSTSNIYKFDYYYKKAGLKTQYFLDSTNLYYKVNCLEDNRLQTLLVYRDNKVKLIGDPFASKNLMRKYKKMMQ